MASITKETHHHGRDAGSRKQEAGNPSITALWIVQATPCMLDVAFARWNVKLGGEEARPNNSNSAATDRPTDDDGWRWAIECSPLILFFLPECDRATTQPVATSHRRPPPQCQARKKKRKGKKKYCSTPHIQIKQANFHFFSLRSISLTHSLFPFFNPCIFNFISVLFL